MEGKGAAGAYVAVRSKRLKSTLNVVTQYLMAGAKLKNCMVPPQTQRYEVRFLLLLATTQEILCQSQKVWAVCAYMCGNIAYVKSSHEAQCNHEPFSVA